LAAQGITVQGEVARAAAPSDAVALAEVRSPTVAKIVDRMLQRSDNDVSEALGHLVGVRGAGEGSFSGGARATLRVLGDLGVPTVGVRLVDASGLARQNLIPAGTLTAALRSATTNDRPELRGTLTGLPVGALNGTLDDRFGGQVTSTAAGQVRGKTGTLTGVTSLSGTVVDRQGRLLIFAVLADRVPAGGGSAAEDAIDRIIARLAACGCA
jgi:D-alanyl-D-alanine carboxypeptidase/D-alanyl-D-alanine-endopeptidase (penicillin-binding protein 4)